MHAQFSPPTQFETAPKTVAYLANGMTIRREGWGLFASHWIACLYYAIRTRPRWSPFSLLEETRYRFTFSQSSAQQFQRRIENPARQTKREEEKEDDESKEQKITVMSRYSAYIMFSFSRSRMAYGKTEGWMNNPIFIALCRFQRTTSYSRVCEFREYRDNRELTFHTYLP